MRGVHSRFRVLNFLGLGVWVSDSGFGVFGVRVPAFRICGFRAQVLGTPGSGLGSKQAQIPQVSYSTQTEVQ